MATKTVRVSPVLAQRAREQVDELRAIGRTPSRGTVILANARPAGEAKVAGAQADRARKVAAQDPLVADLAVKAVDRGVGDDFGL